MTEEDLELNAVIEKAVNSFRAKKREKAKETTPKGEIKKTVVRAPRSIQEAIRAALGRKNTSVLADISRIRVIEEVKEN